MEKIDIQDIIMIFISVIVGVGLTTTMSSEGEKIADDANSSAILKILAPYLGVIWFVGCLSIAGAFGYRMYKRH